MSSTFQEILYQRGGNAMQYSTDWPRDSILVSEGGHFVNYETWRGGYLRRRKIRRMVKRFIFAVALIILPGLINIWRG